MEIKPQNTGNLNQVTYGPDPKTTPEENTTETGQDQKADTEQESPDQRVSSTSNGNITIVIDDEDERNQEITDLD